MLDEAEATSGLEPASAEEGKAGTTNACINGRRVEVLSRTIKILKKLLEEKRNALSGGATLAAAAAAPAGGCSGGGPTCGKEENEEEEGPVLHSLLEKFSGEEKASLPAETAGASAPPGVPNCQGPTAGLSRSSSSEEDPAAAAATAEGKDGFRLHEAPAAMATGSGTANPPPPLVHHMAMPVPGGHHHAPIMMPPGYAGMSAPHGMPGHPGQPIFIAVPMYMPQGQSMAPHAPSPGTAAESAVGQASPAAHSLSNLPGSAAAEASSTQAEAALRVAAENMKKAMGATMAKEGWAMPAGLGYPSMTTLQMPQFVTQALSSEEADETPTHAVCA